MTNHLWPYAGPDKVQLSNITCIFNTLRILRFKFFKLVYDSLDLGFLIISYTSIFEIARRSANLTWTITWYLVFKFSPESLYFATGIEPVSQMKNNGIFISVIKILRNIADFFSVSGNPWTSLRKNFRRTWTKLVCLGLKGVSCSFKRMVLALKALSIGV